MPPTTDSSDDIALGDLLARIPRGSLLAAVLFLYIATRIGWLIILGDLAPGTSGYYASCAQKGIDCKQAVYRDFDLEYPPVAWWLMATPRQIDSRTFAELTAPIETIVQFQTWYFGWFHFELLLADLICLGLMFAIGKRISRTASLILPSAYTAIIIAQPYLAFDTLDLVLLLFFLLCIYCWLRSLDVSAAANRWAIASYFFLGLGISFKIIPLVFVPFFLLADLRAGGSVWRLAGRSLSLAVAAAGPFLIYVPSAGWGVFKLFGYHFERGVHLESVWGSMMLVAAAFGMPCETVGSHGSFDLVGGWSSTLRTASTIALVLTIASLGLWALLRGRRYDRRLALDSAILALVNSIVLSHVYSPHYAFWLLPLSLLLAINIFPPSRAIWCAFAVLAAAILGTSSWLYPFHWVSLVALDPLPVALSVTRSACLVGLTLLLDIRFFATYGKATEKAMPAEATHAATND